MLMSRLHRLSLPHVTHHVLQRGNNNVDTFYYPCDYKLYLDCLHDAVEKYDVMLHAYCLMPNHVHLLMTPKSKVSISRVMQYLGRCFVRYMNDLYGRSGTLWEGRHNSCLIEDHKVLDCYYYIEMNPVRSGLCSFPTEYQWSSCKINTYGITSKLNPHKKFLALGNQGYMKTCRCCSGSRNILSEQKLNAIREATNSNRVYGSEYFIDQLENKLNISLRKGKPGRPRISSV